jgi:hypothetical protein
MWPSSSGKGPSDYVDEASARLDRDAFERELRQFVGQAVKLSKTHVKVLFHISEENCRTANAIHSMKRKKVIQDWRHRDKLIADTDRKLTKFEEYLQKTSADGRWPATVLLAASISAKVVQFREHLNSEFEYVKQHQRLSESILGALSLKDWRNSYVAELDYYLGHVAFPRLPKRKRELLLAGAMSAAHVFTASEKADDILERIAMARSRAKDHIKEARDRGDFPVFRTTPRKRTSL